VLWLVLEEPSYCLNLVGKSKAKEMHLTGRNMDAEEADISWLVNLGCAPLKIFYKDLKL
jgi:Enoyl-CoA hydratase/carnithine racemase